MEVVSVLLACLPSAVVGFGVWLIQRNINKSDKKRAAEEQARLEDRERHEELRKKQELYLVKTVRASVVLAEATARAVQRIPDAHCNGDMHAALKYAEQVEKEQKDFLIQQGISQIFE